MKQYFRLYRWVLLSLAVTIAILAAAAGYTVGIVSQNSVIAQIDMNIGSIEAYLEKNKDSSAMLTEEFKEEYAAKTRTIAMILDQDSSFITDDRTLEELRVTVNADRISVADTNGSVVASTDPSGEGTKIRSEFTPYLSEKVYTDVLFLLESDTPTIIAASTLDGGHGMIQITFPADNVVSLLKEADLANLAVDRPLYSYGTTSILDADTLKYVSCTDTAQIGKTASFEKSSLKKKKGNFNITDADGNREMVHYQTSGDYVILATVPYHDINHMRNVVIGWIVCGGAGMLAVTALSLRMVFLRKEKSKK